MILAHQVIDDLMKYRKFYSMHKECTADFEALCGFIRDSHKFKFGEYTGMKKMFSGKAIGEKLFYDEPDDLIFPYELCWFEYNSSHSNSNWGILINYEHDTRTFGSVFFGKSKELTEGIWKMAPWGSLVMIGDNLPDQDTNISVPLLWAPAPDVKEIEDSHIDELIGPHILFLAMALKLLNCQNIGTVNQEPPPRLQKKRSKGNKTPLFKYATLILKPVGQKQEKLKAQGLWENCIHFARGGFKVYPAPGLFGKYPGRFWFQPCIRGKKGKGIKIKDYDVTQLKKEKP